MTPRKSPLTVTHFLPQTTSQLLKMVFSQMTFQFIMTSHHTNFIKLLETLTNGLEHYSYGKN